MVKPRCGKGLLYIKSNLSVISLTVNCPNVHAIHLVSFNCYVVVVYRPPSYSSLENTYLINFLQEFCVGKEVIILGDFNLPTIDWSTEDALILDYDSLTMEFTNCFNFIGLHQWVNFPTFFPSGNILDLVLSTEEDRIYNVQGLSPLPGCGHIPIIFDYLFMLDSGDGNGRRSDKRAWFRGKYYSINTHLSRFDWDYEFHHLSADAMLEQLLNLISPLIEAYVPLCVYSPPKPMLNPPKTLKRDRRLAWQHFKNTRSFYGRHSEESSQALSYYNTINQRFKNYFITSQVNYERNLVANLKTNPKSFHRYIRNKKVGTPSVGPLKRPDGLLEEGCGAMAELFVDSFASVFKNDHPVPSAHQHFYGSLESVNINITNVTEKLCVLDSDSSMGPDGLHPMLLKSCPALAYPIYKIFASSLQTGTLPHQWKLSEIVPLFKRGSRSDPLNYRPISLTSVCCKTLERIVVEHMYHYLEENHILSEDQYGFRRGRTVDDQLLLTYDFVTSEVDKGNVVDVVLFDFSKAFDVVNHAILLDKLKNLGISGTLLSWIASFLQDRTMYVSVSGSASSPRAVLSGVPQGSVLGPLLFLVYVNHLPSSIRQNCKIFADDLKIYLKICPSSPMSLATGASSCQHDIDNIYSVATSWGLDLNREKCVVLRFHRGAVAWQEIGALAHYTLTDQTISMVTSHKDLGVTIDSSLRFHLHIRSIVNKASGLSTNLLRSTLCRSPDFMISLYKTHIRPLLEYSSCVWNTGYIGDLRMLESVQRKWTKHIDGLGELPYSERLQVLGLYSVQGRLLRADIIKYWKIFHNESSIIPDQIFNLAPPYITRGHRFKILHSFSSLEARRRFFSIRCVGLWNSIPDEIVSLNSVHAFKSALHTFLGHLLYKFPN